AQYLSPEQAQGHPVSAASDLYAIGIVLYELLTGQIPFDGETAVTIALKQVSAAAPAPSALNPAIPPALDAVVDRALAKDPAQRFANADEFIATLQSVREQFSPERTRTLNSTQPNGHPGGPPSGLLLASEVPRQRDNRLAWITAVVVSLLLIAGGAYLLLMPAKQVRVPNVSGLSRAAATATLARAGMQPRYSGATSSNVPAGYVIGSSPPAGREVSKGSAVTLLISSGPGSAALPEVAGLSADRAKARLVKDGFKPTLKSQASTAFPAGQAIGTDPPAGTPVRLGGPVKLLVSSGPAQITVPEVVGDTQAQAKAALSAEGLKLGAVSTQVSTQTPGTVISQSPEGGQQAAAGSSVDLTLSQATKKITVPEVVEEKEELAVGELHGAGFEAKVVKLPVTEAAQNGIVLSQDPKASTKAKRGSTVTIRVGMLQSPTEPTTTTGTTTGATSPPAPTPGPSAPVVGQ
ncbi:MAG: PASTA domain-containing protein, partial [Solirubrobacteraceae bacterium]